MDHYDENPNENQNTDENTDGDFYSDFNNHVDADADQIFGDESGK